MMKINKYSELGEKTWRNDLTPRVKDTVFIGLDTSSEVTPTVKLIDDIGLAQVATVSLSYRNASQCFFNVILPSSLRNCLYHLSVLSESGEEIVTQEFEVTKRDSVTIKFKNTHCMPQDVPFNVIEPKLVTSLIRLEETPMSSDVIYDNTRGSKLALSSHTWNEWSMTIGPLSDQQMTMLNSMHLWDATTLSIPNYAESLPVLFTSVSFSDRQAELTYIHRRND